MSKEISFCPLCAGKLDGGDDNKYTCEDCETEFFIKISDDEDDDDDEEEEEEEEKETDDEDEDEEEEDKEDEY